MKRKAIQLANQTLVVSLPAKWVKQQGIKKGDEIEVKERGNNLIIECDSTNNKSLDKATVDTTNIRDLYGRTVSCMISGLNKAGFNEIKIKYDKHIAKKIIEKLSREVFIGFPVVEQEEGMCVLRSISKDIEFEFNAALRRAFLVTISMGESIINAIKAKKLLILGELLTLEHTNNQLTQFCERILNMSGYKDYTKTCFMYVIAWNLEKVCDEYKYICEYFSKEENNKTKIGKDIILLFEKVNKFIASYYELLYKFDINKLNEQFKEYKQIEKKALELSKSKNQKEIFIITRLLFAAARADDFCTSVSMANFERVPE